MSPKLDHSLSPLADKLRFATWSTSCLHAGQSLSLASSRGSWAALWQRDTPTKSKYANLHRGVHLAEYFDRALRNALYPLDVVDELEAATMPKVEEWMATKPSTSNCTLENAAIRREWYVLFPHPADQCLL